MPSNENKTIENIFAYDGEIIDIQILESKGIDTLQSKIYFCGVLLNGGTESTLPYNECFFGSLTSNDSNDLDESKPIYYLESNLDSNGYTQTLQIFLNNHKLTILNYSLLDSSLNIKLECKSKESNAIKENEINQRNKDKQQSNTPTISTAFFCPILECDELKCIHGGQVKLTSNVGKSIKAMTKDKTHKDSPIMLESDLLYSPILNCPNNIAGIPNPCGIKVV